MTVTSRALLPIAICTGAYMLAAGIAAVITGNAEFAFYIAVMLVLIAAILVVHHRVGLRVATLWLLSIWGLVHMAGGLIPMPEVGVLYNWRPIAVGPKYDQVVHAYGFGTTTWLCWQILRRHLPADAPRLGSILMAGAAGMGFGALNEVVEFAATRMMETNVGGYVNTGWDLVSNLVGCVSVMVWLGCARRDRRPAHAASRPGGEA